MARLMHIGFDNSSRLYRNVYYFEYKGIRYKLIQNNIKKWCDVLLTILPGNIHKKTDDQAYITASEFLSALSWENNSLVKLRYLGGHGIPDNFQLRKAKCRSFGFTEIPFTGHKVGYDIFKIPDIEIEEQKNGLMLFREALSSNNEYLAFLFFWQLMEIGKGDPIGWINKTYRRNRGIIGITKEETDRLPLKGKKIGV